MQIQIRNFGPIKAFDFDLKKDLVMIFGKNNIGKSYGIYIVYLLVKTLGDKLGDPFQLHVKMPEMTAEMSVNLTDVGYGVSQSLPIIVQSILRTGTDWLLLQQPEVHLHPRAQAALGSFFVRQVAENNRRFVIETHSC
jgi:predicted ATPase